MSGVVLHISVDNREVLSALGGLQARLSDLQPAMRDIGDDIKAEVDNAFRSGQSPYGEPWAPLSPVTIARRRKNSSVPLRDTGRLANSISVFADAHSVTVGTNVEYASTHQFGARRGEFGKTRRGNPIPWGSIPARPFMPLDGLPPSLESEVLDTISHHLSRALDA